MPIRWIPLFAGVVPFVGVHICYAIAVKHGYLPACIPYLEGCSSISAAGRNPPANMLFRAIELPVAALLIVVWYYTVEWLRALKPALSNTTTRAILISGVTGALALIVYTTFLGTKEPFYEFMRRFGIYFYFLGVTLAQLFTALSLRKFCRDEPNSGLASLSAALLGLSVLPFVLGILNLIQKAVLPHATADAVENSIEWIAAAMLQFFFVVLYFAWRHTDFNVRVTVKNRRDSA